MSSCPSDLRKQTSKHILCLAQITLLSVMGAYASNIKKSKNTFPQNLCVEFSRSKDIVLYSTVASLFYNLFFLAFQYKLPTESSSSVKFTTAAQTTPRWVVAMVYLPLAVVGIMNVGISTHIFLKIRSMTNEPPNCQSLVDQYKIFFILSLSINVFQAFVSLWIVSQLYLHVIT